MKTRSIFLLIALLIVLPEVSSGQGYLLRRAINKKLENKVDSAVDKSERDEANKRAKEKADKDKTDSNATHGKSGTKETGRGLFGGKIDIKYDDEYKFSGRMVSQIEWYDKKDVRKVDCFTYFNQNTMNAGMDMIPVDIKEEDKDKTIASSFIFDIGNKCFMMMTTGNDSKTGIISEMPSDSTVAAKARNEKSNLVITKTGNSRTIAGYKCDEYKVADPDEGSYSNVWMTKDVKVKADKKYWGKSGVPSYYGYPAFEGAVMLAMESFDKKDKPEMKMETKEINDKFDHSISTVGYTFMKMDFGQAGTK